MRRTRSVAVAGLAALALLTAGCREGEDPDAAAPEGGDTPTASTSPSTSESQAPDDPGQGDSPGGTKPFGESVEVTYERPGADGGKVRVTPKKVEKGTAADLDGAQLTPDQKSKQPYFVTMTIRNVDSGPISQPATGISLTDSSGEPVLPLTTTGDEVSKCVNEGDPKLAPGAEETRCRVVLLDSGETPGAVSYQASYDEDPVLWKMP